MFDHTVQTVWARECCDWFTLSWSLACGMSYLLTPKRSVAAAQRVRERRLELRQMSEKHRYAALADLSGMSRPRITLRSPPIRPRTSVNRKTRKEKDYPRTHRRRAERAIMQERPRSITQKIPANASCSVEIVLQRRETAARPTRAARPAFASPSAVARQEEPW